MFTFATRIALAILVPMLLCGCNPGRNAMSSSTPDQTHVCQVSFWHNDGVAASCQVGQKVVFLPDNWGNEQLPILFAASNCDLRYSVALTNGAVTCIFAGPLAPDHPAAPAPAATVKAPAAHS